MKGGVALFSFEVRERFSHGNELIGRDFMVFVDFFQDNFLGAKDGSEEGDLKSGGVVEGGGVGDATYDGGQRSVDEVIEGGGGVEDVLELLSSCVVDEVWRARSLNVLSNGEGGLESVMSCVNCSQR